MIAPWQLSIDSSRPTLEISGGQSMKAILSIPAAGGGFFFSAWLTMIFWGIIAPDFGIATVGYV